MLRYLTKFYLNPTLLKELIVSHVQHMSGEERMIRAITMMEFLQAAKQFRPVKKQLAIKVA